jgi:hypothetical protein
VSPPSIPADGTDGYVHRVVLTGTNLATTTSAYATFAGTVDPSLCDAGVVSLTDLVPNGAVELAGNIRIAQECPTGTWDVWAHDAGAAVFAVCKACLTVTAHRHAVVVDSFTPSHGRKGQTIDYDLKGHGLQHGSVVFATHNAAGQLVIGDWHGGAYVTETEIVGTVTPSAANPGCTQVGPDCSPPGPYSVIVVEDPYGNPATLPLDGRNVCPNCFLLESAAP